MKRTIVLTVALSCLMLTACDNASIGVIGGADGPTQIIVGENDGTVKGQFGEQLEKKPVRMFNVDGVLYYDTGLVNENTKKCGTMDGELKKTVNENEIPLKSGESNFDSEGYQHATSITKEVNVDGKWAVFKKYDGIDSDAENLKYCYYIKGHLNNAAVDSEMIVLSEYEDITFNDVYEPLLSSQYPVNTKGKLSYEFLNSDEWGIRLWADDVSSKSVTVYCEQLGGNVKGELQTGAPYTLEVWKNDKWKSVKTKSRDVGWDSIAYGVNKNDITSWDINFEFIYDELTPGRYRVGKEITAYISAGNKEDKTYYAEFTIEE